jgi:hypothetical protein
MKVGYKSETDLKNEKLHSGVDSKHNLTILEDTSNSSDKYVVWHIEGGLGKNIAATALIAPLKEKYKDRKLILVVSYPEVFLNHPDIHRVYRVGMVSYFYDDYIRGKDTIVFRHEPYFQSDHIMKKKHLIENWADLLEISYKKNPPILYPNLIQNDFIYNWKREKPTLIIHTNGGGLELNSAYSWTRDIPYAIANAIVNRYSKDYHIIQVGRDKAYSIEGVEFMNMRMSNYELFSILPLSKKRVLIDSSLQHAAAAMQLKSTVLWIGTSPNNFGYDIHDNIVANPPKGNVKMVDSYLFDYSFEGLVHECPYMDINEMFDMDNIFKSIDKQ